MTAGQAFDIARLLTDRGRSEEPYSEFLRVPSISMGLYVLPAGGTDRQSPHTEDEVYYVLWGKATLRLGPDEHAVGPGSVFFVPAKMEHRFHDIVENLAVLVFFSPAEGSSAGR